MVPKAMRAQPKSRRARVVERRRRAFVRLVFAAVATLVLGLVPPLRPLLLAHLALDVVLAGYVLRLRHWARAEQQRRRVVRRLPTSVAPAIDGERAAADSG
jgi:fatty acid desaturase